MESFPLITTFGGKTRLLTMPTNHGDYFNRLTDVLAARCKLTGDSSENIDIGVNSEVICQQFLEKHIPKRYTINLGGNIFGVGNIRSGQIDIIINHDMSMNFLENQNSSFAPPNPDKRNSFQYPLEGCK